MEPARIAQLTFRTPPLTKMVDVAAHLQNDPGGDAVAQVIDNSEIDTKGAAVDLLAEDPRGWSTRTRMDRSLAEARTLGARTAAEALGEAGVEPAEVGMFTTVTTTTHSVPGLDAIAADLGLRPDAQLLSLGPMGCYAAVPALSTCADWVRVHQRPAVLLAVDLFSPHVQAPPYDKEAAVVLTLFGDAAAAVVLLPGDSGHAGPEVLGAAQLTCPEFADNLQVHLGDHGARIRLAPTMPDVVAGAVADPVRDLLARHGVRHDEVIWWAIHPGGKRILDRVDEVLDIPASSMEAARTSMRTYGNTAGPAVLGVLRALTAERPLAAGEHGIVLAFGPGATIWAMLLRGPAL